MSAKGYSKVLLAAAVANAGTVTLPYPTGTVQADFTGETGGQVAVGHDVFPEGTGAGTVTIVYGASNITITNNSGVAWPAGTEVIGSYGRIDINGSYNLTWPKAVQDAALA